MYIKMCLKCSVFWCEHDKHAKYQTAATPGLPACPEITNLYNNTNFCELNDQGNCSCYQLCRRLVQWKLVVGLKVGGQQWFRVQFEPIFPILLGGFFFITVYYDFWGPLEL